jgi:ribulose bisphosphate carboxylase small subunit
VLAAAAGTVMPVFVMAVEKRESFRTGVWVMGQNVLAVAQKENEQAIARLVKCRETDTWPTGYEDIRTFDYL